MTDTALERFYKFKSTFISSNLPNSVLLELIESYINSDKENLPVMDIPVLVGQLSLFDVPA